MVACFTSSLAGVSFEMVLKNSPANLWVCNVRLSLFSLLLALLPVLLANMGVPFPASLFRHFGVWAWVTVLTQVLSGLITTIVIRHADNIFKGFVTSLSIVISFIASIILFDFTITSPLSSPSGPTLSSVRHSSTTSLHQRPSRNAMHSGSPST